MRIAIVGAGISGTLSAYYLTLKGHDVTVFEREPDVALSCSKANGGQISVCNAETWNTVKNIKKGIKWMFKKDAPLLIRPNPSIKKIAWLAGFLRHTFNGTQITNTIQTIKMGMRSSQLYDDIIATENIHFEESKCGLLHVYCNEKSLSAAYESQQLFEDHGVQWKFISRDEILKLDGNLGSFKNLQGGFLTSSDWTGDANLFCRELSKICQQKGAVFNFNTEVLSITDNVVKTTSAGHDSLNIFDAIVLCNGHEIARHAKKLGDFLNVYPVKGYSITIHNAFTAPYISLLDDDKKIVCSRLGDRLRVAGTAELDDGNPVIRPDRIKPLVNWVEDNFPQIDLTNYDSWACQRPMNSNMMPIVKRSKSKYVFYHGGHGHLGWTLGAATAEELSRII